MIRSVKIGLIGGSVVIYLAMTGILERFDQRPVITGVIGLGLDADHRRLLHHRLPRRSDSQGRT